MMSHQTPDNIVLDFLREHLGHVNSKLDRLTEDLSDIKRRVTSLETQVALLHTDFVGQSARLDHIEAHMERIERCLDPVEAAP